MPKPHTSEKFNDVQQSRRINLEQKWTPHSVPDMADDVGKQLRNLFALAYSVPMFYLHASEWSVQQQMSPGTDGVPFFQHQDKEWKDSHTALVIGCALVELLAR